MSFILANLTLFISIKEVIHVINPPTKNPKVITFIKVKAFISLYLMTCSS